jgi:hypothetical protein
LAPSWRFPGLLPSDWRALMRSSTGCRSGSDGGHCCCCRRGVSMEASATAAAVDEDGPPLLNADEERDQDKRGRYCHSPLLLSEAVAWWLLLLLACGGMVRAGVRTASGTCTKPGHQCNAALTPSLEACPGLVGSFRTRTAVVLRRCVGAAVPFDAVLSCPYPLNCCLPAVCMTKASLLMQTYKRMRLSAAPKTRSIC